MRVANFGVSVGFFPKSFSFPGFSPVVRFGRDGHPDGFLVDVQTEIMHFLFMSVWFLLLRMNQALHAPFIVRIGRYSETTRVTTPESNTRSTSLLSHRV
jgi:hypothetical protein